MVQNEYKGWSLLTSALTMIHLLYNTLKEKLENEH
jgi:hypothetical protein